jgi:hypothetical protein
VEQTALYFPNAGGFDTAFDQNLTTFHDGRVPGDTYNWWNFSNTTFDEEYIAGSSSRGVMMIVGIRTSILSNIGPIERMYRTLSAHCDNSPIPVCSWWA